MEGERRVSINFYYRFKRGEEWIPMLTEITLYANTDEQGRITKVLKDVIVSYPYEEESVNAFLDYMERHLGLPNDGWELQRLEDSIILRIDKDALTGTLRRYYERMEEMKSIKPDAKPTFVVQDDRITIFWLYT